MVFQLKRALINEYDDDEFLQVLATDSFRVVH